jgi:hypothetical protein
MESSADALRLKLFARQEVEVVATNEFPKVYGLVMDWAVGNQTSTTFAMCNGRSGLYAPSFLLSDNVMQKRVKNRAISLVKTAGEYYEDAVPTNDYSLPKSGAVRFYLLCFDGARVIESTESELRNGKAKCSTLWGAVQALITDMRRARAGHFSKPDLIFTVALVLLLCVHFVGRTFLGWGAWISADDAQRTFMNSIAKVWDDSPWLDIPLIALALGYAWSSWRKTRTSA